VHGYYIYVDLLRLGLVFDDPENTVKQHESVARGRKLEIQPVKPPERRIRVDEVVAETQCGRVLHLSWGETTQTEGYCMGIA
jgi:hypothetical protein